MHHPNCLRLGEGFVYVVYKFMALFSKYSQFLNSRTMVFNLIRVNAPLVRLKTPLGKWQLLA